MFNLSIFRQSPVIEVKSVLTISELEDAAEKIRIIKNLERKNGSIGGILFAYKSAWKKDPIRQIAHHIQRINSALSPSEYMDMVCVLDAGLLQLFTSENEVMICNFDLEIPTLLWFFINTLDFLGSKVSTQPYYADYMSTGAIGLAEMMTPKSKI